MRSICRSDLLKVAFYLKFKQGAQVAGGRPTGQGLDSNIEKTLDGYKVMNSLLQKFIDHVRSFILTTYVKHLRKQNERL